MLVGSSVYSAYCTCASFPTLCFVTFSACYPFLFSTFGSLKYVSVIVVVVPRLLILGSHGTAAFVIAIGIQ